MVNRGHIVGQQTIIHDLTSPLNMDMMRGAPHRMETRRNLASKRRREKSLRSEEKTLHILEGTIDTTFQLKLCCLIFEQKYFSKLQVLYRHFPAQ